MKQQQFKKEYKRCLKLVLTIKTSWEKKKYDHENHHKSSSATIVQGSSFDMNKGGANWVVRDASAPKKTLLGGM